jgi:hypothetical protein
MPIRLAPVIAALIALVAACAGPRAPAPPPAASPTPAPARTAAVPAAWPSLKSPDAACQLSVPDGWQVAPEAARAQVPGTAEAAVRTTSAAEARSLKGALQFQTGGIVHVDSPERWMVEVNDGAQVTYYVHWPMGEAGCLATVQYSPAQGRDLQAVVLQVVDAAGVSR